MNNNSIYLMSSNATKEYIIDILEVLSLPFGTVQHFRYQLKWLDNELKNKLPIKNNNQTNELKKQRVVVCYLYQEKENSEWKWIAVYPVRTGILVEAYKTGDNDEDIAHFYFKVANYIYYTQKNFTDIIKRIANKKWGKNYALIGQDLGNNYIAKREDSSSAFHKICNSLNLKHFKSPEGISYFPVYCFIKGLKNKKGETIMPLYDPYTYRSFYKITEGEYYVFEFGTYFNLQPPKYTVKLLSDDRIFSTPREYELRASSRYDEISYPIVSSLLERDIWTSILFKTELKEKVNDKEPLNIHLEFLVKLRRKIIYRILDVLGDLGFGVGTGAIALKAAFPPQQMTWWYWPTILGYALWAMCKIIIKFWRG